MRKKYIFGKKLYISVLTMIVVLLTTVATTFAWVGVFANSTFDTFTFNIVRSDLSDDYNIIVSSTGKTGTFSDSIDSYDIKRQILKNWGYDESLFLKEDSLGNLKNNEEKIDTYYSVLNLDQVTTLPVVESNSLVRLGDFHDIYGESSKKYFKFDIYIAIEQIGMNSTSDFNLDVFLGTESLQGRTKGKDLLNPVTYGSNFTNPYVNMINTASLVLPDGHTPVKANHAIQYAQVDSKYASRLAFEKYEVVEKGNPDSYSNKAPKSCVIYTGDDYEYPVLLDSSSQLYDFGAILPNEQNFAILNYNSSEWEFINWKYWVMSLPDDIYDIRGPESSTKDLMLNTETNHLIDSSNSNEVIGINDMMKMTVYFWFEGWDADCWNAINLSPVTINIDLKMKNEE